MKFNLIRNVKAPSRKNGQDAGFDLYIPEYDSNFARELLKLNTGIVISKKEIKIQPHCSILIPSGVKSSFESNIALIIKNKSGVSSKKHLDVMACVIDSSYQGEIHINLVNTSENEVTVLFGEKITQAVPFYIYDKEYEVFSGLSDAEFYSEKTDRGSSGFGSNYQDAQEA